MRVRALIALPPLLLGLAAPAWAREPDVAALQVALRAHGVYEGDVDGLHGPATAAAVRAFQRRVRLPADGVVGPRTRRALRHVPLGSRVLRSGRRGWDVAALQFALAWSGFPSGTIDGVFGSHTDAAVRRFQHHARIAVDGEAGPATFAALQAPPPQSPLAFSIPIAATATDGFGPRGARFHTGLDFPAPAGTPVRAARTGRVTYAGWYDGYGLVVALAHGAGVRTYYAHLSRVDVFLGRRVTRGSVVGAVGSTGISTGPHLHFEVRVRGAAVDPAPTLFSKQ